MHPAKRQIWSSGAKRKLRAWFATQVHVLILFYFSPKRKRGIASLNVVAKPRQSEDLSRKHAIDGPSLLSRCL
jgi:hypothetical protein